MRHRWLPLLALFAATIVAGAIVGLGARAALADDDAPSLDAALAAATQNQRFSLARFEFEHLFAKPLAAAADWLRGRDHSPAADARTLARYFALSPDSLSDSAVAERQALENQVERIIEARVGAALRHAGLARPLPLFDDQEILWPPVDLELTPPPRVLVVSPRGEIRLLRTLLLTPDLNPDTVTRIEAAVERDGRYSALVDRIGGLAAYPALVHDARSYRSTLQAAVHEWAHHYLAFYPLGLAFFRSDDLRTINETVANIVAAEIASLVLALFPSDGIPEPPPADTAAPDALLRSIRRTVDALLAQGRVQEAEARMEEGRRHLAALGLPLRRLNQAYFAFNGLYADTSASSSPLGPLLQDLRAHSASLQAFVARVREVTSVAELQALAAER